MYKGWFFKTTLFCYTFCMDLQTVEKLAQLARIEISAKEKEELLKDLQGILGYIDQVQSVSVDMGEREAGEVRNVMREDVDPHEAGMYTEKILASAPASENGYVKVKQIL